jgi:hypothetical protein
MKYDTYANFNTQNIDAPTPFSRYIVCTTSERQFHFTEPNTLIEKYLYKLKRPNKTSLTSVQDGDPVIFFVDGDYTVQSGTTITPTNRCKGLYMFINGTLTNNGTISMTARGANAEGRFVTVDTHNFIDPKIRYDTTNRLGQFLH